MLSLGSYNYQLMKIIGKLRPLPGEKVVCSVCHRGNRTLLKRDGEYICKVCFESRRRKKDEDR